MKHLGVTLDRCGRADHAEFKEKLGHTLGAAVEAAASSVILLALAPEERHTAKEIPGFSADDWVNLIQNHAIVEKVPVAKIMEKLPGCDPQSDESIEGGEGYKPTWESLERGFKEGATIPMPIVYGEKSDKWVLFSGRHRVGQAIKHNVDLEVLRIPPGVHPKGEVTAKVDMVTARAASTEVLAFELYKTPMDKLDMKGSDEELLDWAKKNLYDVHDIDLGETVKNFRKEIYAPVANKPSIEIYRSLNLESADDYKTKGFGVCWAFDERSNEYVQSGRHGRHRLKTLLFKGEVSPKDINWGMTLVGFINWPEQNECRLNKGARIKIMQIDGKPLEEMKNVTAAAIERLRVAGVWVCAGKIDITDLDSAIEVLVALKS
jgi:hypothetical protein